MSIDWQVSSAIYFRVAGANNFIVRDARVLLASPWSRWRPTIRPYSMDLRERVAAAIDAGEGSQRQVAKRFRVSVSFVTRLVQRRRDAGTLALKPPRRQAVAGPRLPRASTTGGADRRAPRCHPETTERVGRLRLHPDDPLAHPPPLPPDLQEEDPACRRAGHSRGAGQAAEIPGEGAANRGKTAGFRRRDGGQHGDDADPRLGTAG